MSNNVDTQILEEVTCFNLNITLWSGRKKLHENDLKLTSGKEIPPSEMASIGSFKLIDQDSINKFNKLKRRMHTTLEHVGIRFLGGAVYAVPNQKVEEVRVKLNDCLADAEMAKDEFIQDYPARVTDWINRHNEWRDLIERSMVPVTVVANKISFDYTCFAINPVIKDGEDSLCGEVDGLTGQLYKEIAQAADLLFDKSMAGKDSVSQKVKGAVVKLREKLEGLSFLDSRITPLVQSIDSVIHTLPKTGPIMERDLASLCGLILLMSSPDKMRMHGEGLMPLNAVIPMATVEDDTPPVLGNVVSLSSTSPQPALDQNESLGSQQDFVLEMPADFFG
jgi:hypothetical protein